MELLMPALGFFFWTLVAFIIVFLILKKFAWKPILTTLSAREKNIADSIATAERVKNEMAQMKSENEALMAQAREERSALLKEARDAKDKIVHEAKEQAKAEAAKIVADAQAVINQQKMATLVELKNQVGVLVLDVAEKVLRKELGNKPEQEQYIQQLANDIKLN
ncbi:F0F1 ATP synthase subunit B [Pinibacter aurantiacus]|uniref:ATP synthase subunit b n=1 Tax=Pinibacter aurantiacus TaxID=2851599 RepID=A0A9E2W8F1_9BACT|nr:F0F1 ATP synthase subunit B [Pinibacter aurantiacus]MBV4358082.1 F0F1 ATP synthase subunit B [Pinibacter aurantiacus]